MKLYIKLLLPAIVVAVVFQSCSKSVEGFNESPNNAVTAPLGPLITGAQVGMIQPFEGEDARLACMWSRQFTGSDRQYSAFNVYQINSENFDWSGFYYAAAKQAQLAEAKAMDEANGLYIGMAKMIQAMSYGTVASLYGDAPFAQANDLNQFSDPNYDGQMDIYTGVQTMLDDAITQFNSGIGSDVYGADIFFGGDAAKWAAAAWTVKARFYMHVGNYTQAAAAAANGIGADADNMMIPHTGGAYNQDMNLYHSFIVPDRAGYLSANDAALPTMLDTGAANTNSRNNANTNEGARFADIFVGDAPANYDLNSAGRWSATSPFPLVSAAENSLILAECAVRGGDNAGALGHLNDVRTALAAAYPGGTYTAYALTDFDAGGVEDNGQGSQDQNLLFEILEEKYVSLVGQIEVFNDLRRTNNFLGLSPTTGGNLPERFLYPQEEIDANTSTPSPIPDIFVATTVNQ